MVVTDLPDSPGWGIRLKPASNQLSQNHVRARCTCVRTLGICAPSVCPARFEPEDSSWRSPNSVIEGS